MIGIPVILTIAGSSASCGHRHTGHPDHKKGPLAEALLYKNLS
ncbi:MAG: hypothetical protein ACLGHN_06085 [Bacteriovoracia bacterium]